MNLSFTAKTAQTGIFITVLDYLYYIQPHYINYIILIILFPNQSPLFNDFAEANYILSKLHVITTTRTSQPL